MTPAKNVATSFRGIALLGTTLIGMVVAIAACSSSGGKSASTPPPTSHSAASSTASAPASSSATAGTVADAATTAAVTRAYTTFFGGTKDQAALVADLQNGDKLTDALALEAKNPTAATLTATVSKVVLENPHVADVTWTLLSNGKPLLPNTSGKAVLVGGTWKLAADTFCGLVAASGQVPAACSDTSITALPSS